MYKELSISNVSTKKISIPLIAPFVTSLGPVDKAESVFVKIDTKQGITGFGECSPYMSINGESADTAVVVAGYLKMALLGKNALKIKENKWLMDTVIFGNNSVKSAFDMAFYDISSKNVGLPLYEFLGGNNNKQIFTDYTVSLGDPEHMAKAAKLIQDKGFTVIKVKLGNNGQKDIQRITAIREAVGMDIPLRIDANQGWDVEEAINTLQALEKFRIQHCEEPIARWNYMQLPKIKAASPIPIMADESCCDANDAQRLLQIHACDLFNIKLGKSGGIYEALKIVQLAEENNLLIQVGAFLESRLAMTAFAHFALCSSNIQFYDFDTALMFSSDPILGGIKYSEGGKIDLPEEPGIGAQPNFDF